MLNNKLLRNETQKVAQLLRKRGFTFAVDSFLTLETTRKELQIESQELQNKRNTISKEIAKLKAQGENAQKLLIQVAEINQLLDVAKKKLAKVLAKITTITLSIPNIPHVSVPIGSSEQDNKVVKTWGTIPKFDFKIKDHLALGENLGCLDVKTAVKISGSRFFVMHGVLAKLQRALIQFMLDTHISNNYLETYVPYLVNTESLYGSGQLPKFADALFKTSLNNENNTTKELYLIPTAEVPLINIMRNNIVKDSELPYKYVAHTPCFRSEAGSYGKDTRGLIRQHQFEKVELVCVAKAEDSYNMLEQLTTDAENILEQLKLPYRRVLLSTGDLGFSAAKTYDLEVWLPAQNTYREISSCSNCEDFQSRRLNLRMKNKQEIITIPHTLNGSGLAVGRTLVAILENYQNADGSVTVPEVLRKYLGQNLIK